MRRKVFERALQERVNAAEAAFPPPPHQPTTGKRLANKGRQSHKILTVSGPTESQCKFCTKRLKGHGRRWDRPNATAVAALDTLDRNGQWRQVWPNARYATT